MRFSDTPDRGVRKALRALPILTGSAPAAVSDDLPAEPVALFLRWLDTAVETGVPEPHAMTVSTVDDAGAPDARVLALKDVSERGWAFAGLSDSGKGRQLAARPVAALSFWWQPIMRAVRVRGRVEPADPEECLADFRARSPEARARVDGAKWTVWRVVPDRVEFWEGSVDRDHRRTVYIRDAAWSIHRA